MPIKLTAHARARMKERGIGKSIVYRTVMSPDSIEFDLRGGRVLTKRFNNQALKISVIEKGNDIIIKTVFYKEIK